MRVKLDENVPESVRDVLTTAGHDADTVADEGLRGAADPHLLAVAGAAGRLLVTLDRGFGDIRRYPPGSHAGVLVLRLDDQSAPSAQAAIEDLLTAHELETLSGTIAVAQRGMLRIRRS